MPGIGGERSGVMRHQPLTRIVGGNVMMDNEVSSGGMVQDVPNPPRLNPVTLKFRDVEVERDYRRYELASNLGRNRAALWAGVLTMVAFLPLDLLLLQPPIQVPLVRGLVVVPLGLAALWMSYHARALFMLATFVVCSLALLSFPLLLLAGGAQITTYAVMGAVQCLLFLNAVAVLPFARTFWASLLGVGLMFAVLATVSAGYPQLLNYTVAIATIALLSVFVAHSRERTYRRLFVRRQQLAVLTREAADRQSEEIDWLRGLPANLESDMQTQLFALEGQLEDLVEQPNASPSALRAHAQIRSLMAMFETARYASAVDAADTHATPVDLCELLHDVIVTRSRYLRDVRPIRLDAPRGVWVCADAARLRQAIEQIFNGAALRVRDDEIIDVALRGDGSSARLTVSVDRELGDLVSSTLARQPNALGLSLYLANRIFVICGGKLDIDASGSGTVFRVTLPRFDDADRAGTALLDRPAVRL